MEGNPMRPRHRRLTPLAVAVLGALFGIPAANSAHAAPCDEYDPSGPALSTTVTLTPNDSMGTGERELRTFVATGSIGRVDAATVSAVPRGSVRSVSAV